LEICPTALERRAGDLVPGFSRLERGPRLVDGRAQLEIVDLGQHLTRLDEVTALGMDPADVAGHLREDRRLLGGEDVGRERELDLQIAALRLDRAHQHVGTHAGDGAGLLILDSIDDENADDDEKTEDHETDGVASHEPHLMKWPVSTASLYGACARSQASREI